MREQLAKLTTPRPLSEYHEDMGDVLWWCWTTAKPLLRKRGGDNELPEPGHWLGEPPYVGSPNDLGQIVEIGIRTARLKHFAGACRVNIGGWPGYHTHFTPLPPMPVKP